MTPTSRRRPRAIWEWARWLGAIAILGILVWLPHTPALFFPLCAGTHIEFQEADLNHDGYVSVGEASYACNVDSRPTTRDGHACTEYYNRVDWRPIKEVCEDRARVTMPNAGRTALLDR